MTKGFIYKIFAILALLGALAFVSVCLAEGQSAASSKPAKHLLVVTVTKGFRHNSIAVGERVVKELAEKSGVFTVDFARTDADLAAKMSPEALKHYDGVFFLNTTGKLPLPISVPSSMRVQSASPWRNSS